MPGCRPGRARGQFCPVLLIAQFVHVPAGPVQQVLLTVRAGVAGVLGELPAVLARQRPEQATHARGRPAPQIRPREDPPHLQQEVFQLISPLIRPLLAGDHRRDIQYLRLHAGLLPATSALELQQRHRTTTEGTVGSRRRARASSGVTERRRFQPPAQMHHQPQSEPPPRQACDSVRPTQPRTGVSGPDIATREKSVPIRRLLPGRSITSADRRPLRLCRLQLPRTRSPPARTRTSRHNNQVRVRCPPYGAGEPEPAAPSPASASRSPGDRGLFAHPPQRLVDTLPVAAISRKVLPATSGPAIRSAVSGVSFEVPSGRRAGTVWPSRRRPALVLCLRGLLLRPPDQAAVIGLAPQPDDAVHHALP